MLPLRVILLFVMASLVGENLIAQSQWDCLGAIPICGNDTIDIISGASEYNDYSNPNNDRGCLSTGEGQHSTWVYFEFRDDMPPDSELLMTLFPPDSTDTWREEDFDFAIYGPNLNCDSLGSPRRCSFARSLCAFCPYTGMGNGALDSQEDAFIDPFGVEVDGFVLPLVAQPGDRFYMLVTKFTGFSEAFAVEWGGEASNYFNCIAEPACINLVNAGGDLNYCKSDAFDVRLDADLRTNSDEELIIQWSGTPEAMALLDSADILNPLVSVPAGFEGSLEYEINVLQGACDRSDKMTISVIGGVTPEIVQNGFACPGESVSLSVADLFESYEWSTGDTTTTVQATVGELYTLTVTNANGCQTSTTFTAQSISTKAANILDEGLIVCGEESTILQLDDTFETYLWSDNSTNPTLSITAGGTYSVTVTDENGCTTSDSIMVQGVDEPQITIDYPDHACVGDAVSLVPDQNFETYVWSDGTLTAINVVTQTGDYILTATAANGCVAQDTFPIRFTEIPAPQITGDTVICDGAMATIEVADSAYSTTIWSTLEEGLSITVSQAGIYEVLVVDTFGCRGVDSILIEAGVSPEAEYIDELEFCEGSSTTLALESNHNAYVWPDGSTGSTLAVNQAGVYAVTVSNTIGCTDIAVFTVIQNEVDSLIIDGPAGLCPDEEGTLTTSPTYSSYIWSTSPTDTNATLVVNTDVASYGLTVVDNNGCQTSATYDLITFPAAEGTIVGDTLICAGEETLLSVTPAMTTYSWFDTSSAPDITIAEAGNEYAVTVTDVNGCQDTIPFTITTIDPIQIPLDSAYQICREGTLNLDIGPDFTSILWSTTDTVPAIEISEAGDYSVLVQDINGCRDTADFNLSTYEVPTPVISGDVEFCPGGLANLEVEGSWASILWSTGETTASIQVSDTGRVSVTVVDISGCVGEGSVVVRHFELVQPAMIAPDAVCLDASFTVAVQDIYRTYDWEGFDLDQAVISPNRTGEFRLTVTDFNGCQQSANLTVGDLDSPTVNLTGATDFCAGSSTSILASGNFDSILWGEGETTESLVVTQGGMYVAIVQNTVGCTALDSLSITELSLPEASPSHVFTLNCEVESVTLSNGIVDSDNYIFEWTGPGILPSMTALSQPTVRDSGWYTLVVESNTTGCRSKIDSIRVNEDRSTPRIGLDGAFEIDCANPTVTVRDTNSFNANYLYQWYNAGREPIGNSNRPDIRVSTTGTLFLEVLDQSSGCAAMDSVTITQNSDFPAIVDLTDDTLTCERSTIDIAATVSNWEDTFEVAWEIIEGDLGTTTTPLSAIANAPGTYVLLVENSLNGCIATDTIHIGENVKLPNAFAGEDYTLDCFTGEASLLAQSAESRPMDFIWTGPNGQTQAGATLTASDVGTYILTVTDPENGCSATDEVQVLLDDNQPTGLEILVAHPLCIGDDNGQISITGVEGGEGPFMFNFNGLGYSEKDTFTNLKPDSYSLTVEDITGCTFTTEVTINAGRDISIDLGEDQVVEKGTEVTLKPWMNIPLNEVASLLITNNEGLSCDSCWIEWDFVPEFSSNFVAKLVDKNGCTAEDKVRVSVRLPRNIYIPNAFSPGRNGGGDGNNDAFTVFSNGDVQEVSSMKVFDRWGDLFFKRENFAPNDLSLGWDGTYNGRTLNTNVFVYVIEIEFKDGETKIFEGDIHLMRKD